MNRQKCTKCGLVSWADAATCKRCGEPLLEQSQASVSSVGPSRPSNVPDIVSCSLLLIGLIFVGLNRYLGPFGYPVSMLAFISGLGYAIVRIYRSKRYPPLDRKREATTALVVNALVVMVLGAAVPVYFLTPSSPETKPFEWRKYVSVNGGYNVQLPDDPQEVQQKTQTGAGPITLNLAIANMGKRGKYVSGYYGMSYRPVNVSDEEFLESVYQTTLTVSEAWGSVLTKKPLVFISPDGLTVQALESEIKSDERTTSIIRLYWVKERAIVYVNLATFERTDKNFESVEKFLDSFELIFPYMAIMN